MDSSKNENGKTPIFCIDCRQNSGYFLEDFIYEKVETTKYCKNCKKIVLEKPNFPKPSLN